MRSAFDAPCPSPVSVLPGPLPEPFDLKWLTAKMKGSPPAVGVKTWAIGSLALSNACPAALWSDSIMAAPSGVTTAG